MRITEELREIAFLDQVRLVAVDHADDVDIFVNIKFKGPPFPEQRSSASTRYSGPCPVAPSTLAAAT